MLPKKVAIIQSNYIPWKGYFDIISSSDLFIIYDQLQYTHKDWRNRNLIKTPQGLKWLSIPVQSRNHLARKISEVKVSGSAWRKRHWAMIQANYAKAGYFKNYKEVFEELYLKGKNEYLSDINYAFIRTISTILGIDTEIQVMQDTKLPQDKQHRVVELCKKVNADIYISGPAGKSYIDQSLFQKAGIKIEWFAYHGYPEYEQFHPPFEHKVSILDLIFHTGPKAAEYMMKGLTK